MQTIVGRKCVRCPARREIAALSTDSRTEVRQRFGKARPSGRDRSCSGSRRPAASACAAVAYIRIRTEVRPEKVHDLSVSGTCVNAWRRESWSSGPFPGTRYGDSPVLPDVPMSRVLKSMVSRHLLGWKCEGCGRGSRIEVRTPDVSPTWIVGSKCEHELMECMHPW